MRQKRLYRVLTRLVPMLIVGSGVFWFTACETGGYAGEPDRSSDRFVLMLSGHWQGQLGPCGCAEHQLGGIDRRTQLIHAIPSARRLLIDTGPLIESDRLQDQYKLDVFLSSMKHLGYDAVGLTYREAALLNSLAIGPEDRATLVSTNMSEASRSLLGVREMVQKTLESSSGRLNCVVLSVYDPSLESQVNRGEAIDFIEPLSAVTSALGQCGIDPEQPSRDQLVIVMVCQDHPELVAKLKQIAGVDLVVWPGYSDEPDLKIDPQGQAAVMTASHLGKYIGWLELPAKGGGQPDWSHSTFKPVAVEETNPRDPVIVNYLNEYQMRLRTENLVADENKLARLPLDDPQARFAGSRACGECHKDIYEKWKTLKHGHAMETLLDPAVNRAYDPECVGCHTVGMYYQGGYRSMETTPDLANVGCESCHGPGQQHIDNPIGNAYQEPFARCEDCHTHENSPEFSGKRKQYFEKIRHWPEPRKYWE